MKRLIVVVLIAVMIMGIGIGSASAANSLKTGSVGINVDVNDNILISGRVFVAPSVAVLAGLGVGVNGGDTTGTDVGVLVGARKYLKTDDFAPFVGGTFFYGSTQKGNLKNVNLLAEAGAEYFLAKQFSFEGKIGFGYMSQETTIGPNTTRNNTVGTQRFGASFNYYFF